MTTIDLRLVEIFCQVYEERSFSRAAARLGLTQPTVSTHIKTLEGSLGTALFHRLGRQTTATRAGELLYEHGRRILEMKRATVEAMNRLLDRLEGELQLGASSIPGNYILPGFLERFRQDHPEVHVRVEIKDTRETVSRVAEGKLDLGFVGARLDRGGLLFRPFASDRTILVAQASSAWKTPAHGWTLAALRQRPMVVREQGSGVRYALENQLARLGLDLEFFDVVAEVSSNTALREAVRRGLGFTYLSRYCVERELGSGELRELVVPGFESAARQLFVVQNDRRPLSPLCEAFLSSQLPRLGALGLPARTGRGARSSENPYEPVQTNR